MSPEVRAALARDLGQPLTDLRPAGGGFTDNWRCRAAELDLFVKVATDADRLAGEADGLRALAACPTLVVPTVRACGIAGSAAYLAMDWLALSRSGDDARLGAAIAALHAISGPAYGWHRANYLGTSPQPNGQTADWARFFADQRLAPQLAMAEANGHHAVIAPGRRLLDRLPQLLASHRPPVALLHGDLWRGNVGFVDGRPAVFDPAVHYGDPECDLAMAALFGGFAPTFFAAHAACHPLPPGWERRRLLYQLYHLLNHLNLFGGGYLGQVLAILEQLT